MKNMNSRILFAAVVLLSLINGCKKDPASSLYDKDYVSGAQPVVTAITPENAPYPLSNVTTLALAGSNFTTDASKIIVFFDAVPAEILSATPTLLRVRTPNLVKDSVKVKVSVLGSDKFSEIKYLNIKPSIVNVDGIDAEKEKPYALAIDRNGNLLVNLTTGSGVGLGVYKITPAGVRTQYALKGTETNFSTLKVGPGDTLLAARRAFAIFYCDPNAVVAPKILVSRVSSPPMNNIDDFDYDAQKNIWGGGDLNTGIYRINKYKQAREFPFSGVVRAVRVFNGALYVGANVITSTDTTEAVYKFPINAADTSLGTPTTYFTLSSQSGYKFARISALTFDAAGTMYVGTDGAAGILVVPGQNAAPVPLMNGLIGPKVVTFQWGTGTILYVVRENDATSKTPQVLLKVDIQKQGAPYYGRE